MSNNNYQDPQRMIYRGALERIREVMFRMQQDTTSQNSSQYAKELSEILAKVDISVDNGREKQRLGA